MADLPEDRFTPGPPFLSVEVDTFGPFKGYFFNLRYLFIPINF